MVCLSFGRRGVLVIEQADLVHDEVVEMLALVRRMAADVAAGKPAVRYPVGPFWDSGPPPKDSLDLAKRLVDGLKGGNGRPSDNPPEQWSRSFYPVANLLLRHNGRSVGRNDLDTLIAKIKSDVAPALWADNPGSGTIDGCFCGDGSLLVVNQTEAVHRQIVDWLTKARAARAK